MEVLNKDRIKWLHLFTLVLSEIHHSSYEHNIIIIHEMNISFIFRWYSFIFLRFNAILSQVENRKNIYLDKLDLSIYS